MSAKKLKQMKKIMIPLQMSLDKGNFSHVINQLQKELEKIEAKASSYDLITDKDVKNMIAKAETLQRTFDETKRAVGAMSKGVQEDWSGISKTVTRVAESIGTKGLTPIRQNITKVKNSFEDLRMEVDRTETFFTKFGRTMVNSLRYQVVNSALDAVANSFQGTMQYFENVDKNLTNISIVSGKTNSEMQGFVRTAQSYAKALGTVTNEYLKAAEFFYQQGLSSNEVLERTNATIQAANISGQSVTDTANQMTAVLNGFDIAASQTTVVLDKMAALGAGTATDFEEIATAVQKVASAANEAGVGLDETLAMISTISSVTREAPESVGTSLNSIISRMNNLTVAEKDNISSYTSQVQKAYESVNAGLTIFDGEGLIKDRSLILSELADKWSELDKNQQATITTALAGTRQANKLYALLGNWTEYESYLTMSKDSKGALEEQNEIYLQSYEAIKNNTKLIQEEIWGNIFDTDMLKEFHEGFLQPILRVIESITKNIGGWKGLMTPLLGLLREPITSIITPSLTNKTFRKTLSDEEQASLLNATQESQSRLNVLGMNAKDSSKQGFELFGKLLDKNIKLIDHQSRQKYFTPEQDKAYIDQIKRLEEIVSLREKILNLSEEVESNGAGSASEQIYSYRQIFGETDEKKQRLKDYERETKSLKSNKDYIKEEAEKLLLGGKVKDFDEAMVKVEREVKNVIKKARTNLSPLLQGIAIGGKKLNDEELKNMFGKADEIEYIEKSDEYRDQIQFLRSLSQSEKHKASFNKTLKFSNFEFNIADLFKADENGRSTAEAAELAQAILSREDSNVIWKEIFNTLKTTMPKEYDILSESLAQSKDSEGQAKKIASEIASDAQKFNAAADTGKKISLVSKAIVGMSGALGIYNVLSDQTLNQQEKLSQSGSQLLSVTGSLLSATHPVVGMLMQFGATVLPAVIKSLGIGVSEYEKLAKATGKVVDAQKALTRSLKEQRVLLSSAETAFSSLAKAYQEGALNVANLTEEQQSMYDQAAEYIAQYNPELIKGYTAEGKAILDLTVAYKDLENSKQGYLRTSLNSKESELYKTFSNSAEDNAVNLYKTQVLAQEEVLKIQNKIFKMRQRMSQGSGDYSDELAKLEKDLASAQGVVSDVGSNWNELVTKPITLSNISYQSLSSSIQDSVNKLSSFSSFINSSLSQDNFVEQTRSLVAALGNASDETRSKLDGMNESIRDTMFELTMNMDMNSSVISGMFESITQDSFLSGEFIDELIPKLEQANASIIGGLSPEKSAELDALQAKLVELNKEKAMWEENQGASGSANAGAYISSMIGVTEMEIEETELGISRILQSYADLQTVQDDLVTNWRNSLVDIASSTNEGFNEVVKQFQKTRDELAKGIEVGGFSEEKIQDYKVRMGAMYTALNSDNADFYVKWRELNADTINTVSRDLGVSAESYRTYSEYKMAIEETLARKKVLMSALASSDSTKIMEAESQFIKETQLQRLENEGLANRQVAASYLKAGKIKEFVDNEVVLNKLKTLRDGLQKEAETSQKGVEVSKERGIKYVQHLNEIGAAGAKIINGMGGEVAFTAQDASFDSISVKLLETINEQIALYEAAQDSITSNADNGIDGKSVDEWLASGGEDFQKYLNSIKMPSFKDFINPDEYGKINLKEITQPNNDINGSGSGSGSKDAADLNFDIDPLKPYQDKIDSITNSLEKMKKARDKLYGKNYLDSLKKEAELNRELLAAEEAKLKKAKELAATNKSQLQAGGVKFNTDGTIANYNEILISLQTATNKLTGEQKEASTESANQFKELMDDYEKYALDTVRTSENAISEIKIALAESARESIEYPIKLILDESNLDKKVFDFLNGISKLENGEIKISFEGETNLSKLSSAMGTLEKIFGQGDGTSFLNSVLNNPDLAGDQTRQREILEGQMENMISLGGELSALVETMDKTFKDGLSKAISTLSDEIAKYNNITVQHQRILELGKALNSTTMTDINETYGAIESIYKNNLSAQQTLAKQMKDSRDQFEVGSKSWLDANEKYLEAQKSVLETEKQIAELLSSRYDDTASNGRKSLESSLFGGVTSKQALKDLEALTKEKNKYLDVQEEVYELSKFERNIQKDINGLQGNPKAQAALRKFQDKELDYLRSKEKITENDLELSRKQYEVFKARIELEKAQEGGKMELMLQRNSDGSYGYMYVKSMEEVDAATQKYEDSINSLYDFAVKNIADLQKESLTIRDEALNEYDSIVADLKAGIIDVATAEEKLGKVFEKVNADLAENAKLQKEMEQQAVSANLLQILGVGGANANLSGPLSTSLTSVFDVLGASGGTSLSRVIESLGYSTSQFVGTTGEQIAQLFEELGGDEGAMTALMEGFAAANDATSATVLGLLKETSDLALSTEAILDASLLGSGQAYEEYLAKISSDAITPEDLFTQVMQEGLDTTEEVWTALASIIKIDLDKLKSEFDMDNPDGILSSVTTNLTTAYTDYNTALTESLDRLRAEQVEVKTSVDAMNTSLGETVIKLGEEIAQLTGVEKGYQAIRDGIIQSITEAGKYVTTLKNGMSTVSTTASNSISSVNSAISGTATAIKKVSDAVKAAGDSAGAAVDKVVEKLKNIDASGLTIPVSAPRATGGVQTVGKEYVHTISAFHTGGKVNVDREGYALLEKNEAVITEQQAQIIARVRDMADSMMSSQLNVPTVGDTNTNTVVNMSFPNVQQSSEIIDAFEGLSILAQQKVKKN